MPRGIPFEKGNKGRPVGATNKLTKTVRETVWETFNKLQETEEHNLSAFAEQYPKEFYQIAAKLIPTEIQAKHSGTIELIFNKANNCDPIDEERS